MSCGGPLSAVMMVAGAVLLQNTGLSVNSALTSNIGNFASLPITGQFSNLVSSATGAISGSALSSLRTLGAGVFPALTNAIPASFTSALGSVAGGGFTGLIQSTANTIMGSGNLGNFAQVFNSAQSFTGLANTFINSNANIGALAGTFGKLTGGMDGLITGGASLVSQSLGALGGDLKNLGSLVNLNNLTNLGNPSALIRQVATVSGIAPGIESALRNAGVSSDIINSFSLPEFGGVSDSLNKALYQGMERITGVELQQVKDVLGVNLPGVANMAQLLDPKTILPTSFSTLTMPTPDGLRGIYDPLTGAVNSKLGEYFKSPLATTVQSISTDLVNQAKLNLPTVTGIYSNTSNEDLNYTGDDEIVLARVNDERRRRGLAPLSIA
jgi:hypothetical protein